ncbi:ATP-binding cassette domain-containing protein [Siccirubricoccus sp. KC 17139]|uniref:ATP-binding cassette domain-containing protein n=1 Tax=Siccirubricoccus soli TaxID=2899147 RepID=A0ABT1D5U9_9PROT|nr:ATP-binding cassette domain-containing protein [Siccirubricoccus soli]MCO6417271.1 ATP-binding cassette domain-containing protein [Siccirubricoccus soli]MCP2683406.1 ATP-binding cassette domain-containing protein [Siccirubricoccus soli]
MSPLDDRSGERHGGLDRPHQGAAPLLELRDIRKEYALRQGLLARLTGRAERVAAVDDVSLAIQPGEVFGLVGESGCGKSTLSQIAVGLLAPSSGQVLYRGADIAALRGEARQAYRRGVQMVFQDTHSSLNPRKRIRRALAEALAASGQPRAAIPAKLLALMDQVGLDAVMLDRLPHELSGGQRQRVGIARALAMDPALLVADEPVSSLDVSLQGQIVNLLRELNARLGLTIVLVSHDLAVVARICQRIAVMQAGQIVEEGPPARVLFAPEHPYTRTLIAAVPRGLAGRRSTREVAPAEA